MAEGLPITAVPGANAAVTALVLSGLPPLPFLVLGFPPPRRAARRAALGRLRAAERAGLTATLIWYEAPHRIAETLRDCAAILGDSMRADQRGTVRYSELVFGLIGADERLSGGSFSGATLSAKFRNSDVHHAR